MKNIQDLASRILRSGFTIALTGAGISVESGIPDFRSRNGLWSRYDPAQYGYIESFRKDPGKVWRMLKELDELLSSAKPNPAHLGLAELERRGLLSAVITQNIDSLHQRAGNCNVIEFHGHNRTLRCDKCKRQFQRESITIERVPPLCQCGNALRPEIVFFGEDIPSAALKNSLSAVEKCELMLIVGTSATVAPASRLPGLAKSHNAYIVEINPAPTELTDRVSDVHIEMTAGDAISALMAALDSVEFRGESK